MPGSTPATSQLDWLSSTTAMIVLSWSKATRDLLKSFSWGIGALRQLFASDDGAISSPPAPYHLSAGGRWIRTSGSAREEIKKSRYSVGVRRARAAFVILPDYLPGRVGASAARPAKLTVPAAGLKWQSLEEEVADSCTVDGHPSQRKA